MPDHNNGSKLKNPNFFIVGAPKCGTTSLASWLTQNENIFMSPIKEPAFFNSDGLGGSRNLRQYEKNFSAVPVGVRCVGEASTHYLNSVDAIENIRAYDPKAKIIVCLRNPVDMAISLHGQRVKDGIEPIADFAQAWDAQFSRRDEKSSKISQKHILDRLQYGNYCELGRQLKRVYEVFPEKQVLPIFLRDMELSPQNTYERVLEFLDVKNNSEVVLDSLNRAEVPRNRGLNKVLRLIIHAKREAGINVGTGLGSWLIRLNSRRNADAGKLVSAEVRRELVQFFSDDISLLERLTDRDLSAWREVQS